MAKSHCEHSGRNFQDIKRQSKSKTRESQTSTQSMTQKAQSRSENFPGLFLELS